MIRESVKRITLNGELKKLSVSHIIVHIMILIVYVSTTVFITQGNYVGYMFRLLNSHLQAYYLQIKSQNAVHTLGSQCIYISELLKSDHLSSLPVKNRSCNGTCF